jgi:hypothetical protein
MTSSPERVEKEPIMATYASKIRKTGIDNTSIQLDSKGRMIAGGQMQPFSSKGNPSVFYVDGNVLTTGDGRTWDSAYKTLAQGLAAAHTYMSTSANRAWAQRATVYACADSFTENLTKFAEKTDVIGVGSTNQHTHTRLIGAHVLEAATEDTYHGCRFYNFEFYGSGANENVTIPADQNGIRFINCKFTPGASGTIGIMAVQSHDMKIIGCEFEPNTSGGGFTTAAIQINAGSVTNLVIKDSYIYSSGIGLDFNPTTTQPINCRIEGCTLICPGGLAIDEESDDLWVIDNRWCCEATAAGSSYDLDVKHAVGNIATGSDVTDGVPFVLTS